MALDIIGISLILIFFIRGYMKGIIVAVFAMLAIVLGIICSLKLSSLLATYLLEKHIVTSGWAQLASYVVIFIGIVFLVRLLAKAIESSFEAVMLGWVNKGIGGLLYAAMATMVWSSFLWIANRMQLIEPDTIAASKTYPYLSQVAPWVFEHIGKLWPMVKDIFHDLGTFFDKVNGQIPDHVDTAG